MTLGPSRSGATSPRWMVRSELTPQIRAASGQELGSHPRPFRLPVRRPPRAPQALARSDAWLEMSTQNRAVGRQFHKA